MFNSILVVCVGNICRSPTGERLLKEYLPEKEISSAGIGALVGNQADNKALKVSLEHNVSLDGHVARQLTASLCRENDLILVMEKRHVDSISNICPEARGKTMLFGHWIEGREIPDPYKKSEEAFLFVYDLLNDAAKAWAKVLSK